MPRIDTTAGDSDLRTTPVVSAASAIERALLVNMSRTEVILVRHGQQDFSLAGRARPGKTDPPLTETGRRQAACVGRYLAEDGIAHVYCSDLRRARETAGILAQHLGTEVQPPTVVPELQEVRLFRGLPKDRPLIEVLGREGLERAAADFMRTRRFDAFPETETSAELRARAVRTIVELAAKHEEQRIAVVAHGGFINSFLAEVLGISLDMFFFPAHASVTRALFSEDRWALYSANETFHLQHESQTFITF